MMDRIQLDPLTLNPSGLPVLRPSSIEGRPVPDMPIAARDSATSGCESEIPSVRNDSEVKVDTMRDVGVLMTEEARSIGIHGRARGNASNAPVLSIVVPVYNETAVLPEFHRRIVAVLQMLSLPAEIIYVNDGSSDQSLRTMFDLRVDDNHVAIVNLSRNFGKEIAVTAGLDHVCGQAAVVIDADLQDPPEIIPRLVAKWREGYDVVYASRRERLGETWLKRTTATIFYWAMHQLGEVPIPRDTGDFRLLNRRCLDALAGCRERRRFMKGLFAWIGFKQIAIVYDRSPRYAGKTKWNYWRLWNFAIEGITSFTLAPLKLATYAGVLTAAIAFLYGVFIVAHTLFLGKDMPGYASLMVVILFLSGVQLTAMGVIGEYVGRIFVECKGRPLYLVDTYFAASNVHQPSASDPALFEKPCNSRTAEVDQLVTEPASCDFHRGSENTYQRHTV